MNIKVAVFYERRPRKLNLTLGAIICILAIGIVANGCATGHSSESHNDVGKPATAMPTQHQPGIALTNAAQIPITVLVKYFVETKMAEIKPVLSLTSGQEIEIREILTRQANACCDTLSNILNGASSWLELNEAARQQTNYEEQIKLLLTPQQEAAYDKLKKEQLTQRAREIAAAQLQQLQAPLQLKADQIDGVFAILAKQAEAHLSDLETNTAAVLNDRTQFDSDTMALRDVLTPEQYKRYQKLREQQSYPDQSFFQKFLQAIGPGAIGGTLKGWR
jgi:hypothetical protein